MNEHLEVIKAEIGDAREIHDLINLYAQRGDMLPRTMGEVFENIRDFFVLRDGDQFLGCTALHIVWSDLAEVKSLSVTEAVQARGVRLHAGSGNPRRSVQDWPRPRLRPQLQTRLL